MVKKKAEPAADKAGRYPRTLYGLRMSPGLFIVTNPSPSYFVGTGKGNRHKAVLAVYELVGYVDVKAGVEIGSVERIRGGSGGAR